MQYLRKNITMFNLSKINSNVFFLLGVFGAQFIIKPVNLDFKNFTTFTLSVLKNNINHFIRQLISLRYGWRVRLKIVGRGISFFKRKNYIYMNIGRSHIVRFFLNNYIRITCQKKRMTLRSLNFDYLRTISYMLITAQPRLTYKAKGLVYQHFVYKVRPGKIKQYRV